MPTVSSKSFGLPRRRRVRTDGVEPVPPVYATAAGAAQSAIDRP
jgi:hypothetical protein